MAVASGAVGTESEGKTPGLLGRVFLVFFSPARAFMRFGNGAGWWLPYLILVAVGLTYVMAIGSRVGWETVARNSIASSPRQQAQIENLPPAQQQQQIAVVSRITRIAAYAVPPVSPLFIAAIAAAVLLATFRFAFGASPRFGPLFAVYLFASLPQSLKALLSMGMLFAGLNLDSFNINAPIGSNPAFYLQGSGAPHWVLSLLGWVDVFTVWQIAVLCIGCSVVVPISRGKAAAAVLGWTTVAALLGASVAALT